MIDAVQPSGLLSAALLLPWLGAVVVALLGRWANVRDSALVATAVVTFGLVLALGRSVVRGDWVSVEAATPIPGVPLAFEVEPLGLLFALVASGLWIVTAVYAFGYMRGHHEGHQTRFFVAFAVAIGAALGIAFARNLLTLFVFYELLTFSTYPLVTHHQDEKARRGGRIYLGFLVSTSIGLLLLAILWTHQLAGSVEFRPGGVLRDGVSPGVVAALFALYAFGIGKAALMPVHRWLPAAMIAPTPVSALLHAVAVVKAGVFSVMKVTVYVVGVDRLAEIGAVLPAYAGRAVLVVAVFTMLAASVVAIRQDNLKRLLAYSTVSQLAYIVVGAAMASALGVVGGSLHIVTHAIGKITLFFCAGAIYVAHHKTEVSEMAGIGRRMPVTMCAFLLASLSLIGLPPFAGAWSKWYLLRAAVEAGLWWVAAAFLVAGLLAIGYLMPVVVTAFFREGDELEDPARPVAEAPLLCVLPLAATAFGCLVLFFGIDPWLDLAQRIGVSGGALVGAATGGSP